MTTKTTFDQSSVEQYRFALGRLPRGYGLWSFALGRAGAWTDFQYTGTYTNGKNSALAMARSLGCETVRVNS